VERVFFGGGGGRESYHEKASRKWLFRGTKKRPVSEARPCVTDTVLLGGIRGPFFMRFTGPFSISFHSLICWCTHGRTRRYTQDRTSQGHSYVKGGKSSHTRALKATRLTKP
jgi:hypothetical protein